MGPGTKPKALDPGQVLYLWAPSLAKSSCPGFKYVSGWNLVVLVWYLLFLSLHLYWSRDWFLTSFPPACGLHPLFTAPGYSKVLWGIFCWFSAISKLTAPGKLCQDAFKFEVLKGPWLCFVEWAEPPGQLCELEFFVVLLTTESVCLQLKSDELVLGVVLFCSLWQATHGWTR